ncbi:hypothetical protein FBEOM_13754 [Fusarium beomiforme]|uniref:HTH psq-type domain-containing protein n=1 Tax=Fusarium beomiforme TaxID=44412 RepID=A0A9P5A543_9HYPO|nr:hypothetical protein FBEOM_13754 [Fusarium beomiforme]
MRRAPYTEDDIIEAILDVTDNGLTQNQAAQKHGIPQPTLSGRLRGVPPKSEATHPAQLLSKSQKSRLVAWIPRQEALGYAPSHSQVRATVAAFLRQQGRKRPMGEREYSWIKPENKVNVDEGGIMAGFGKRLDSLVIGSSDPKWKGFLKGSQSRAWTSFVEAVTADGRPLKPGIIFKDKELQHQWFIDELKG